MGGQYNETRIERIKNSEKPPRKMIALSFWVGSGLAESRFVHTKGNLSCHFCPLSYYLPIHIHIICQSIFIEAMLNKC